MKMRTFALTVIAMLAAPIMAAHGQQYTYPHMSHAMHLYYDQHPDQWQQLLESLPRASFELPPAKPAAPSVGAITGAPASAPSGVGTWTSITHAAPVPWATRSCSPMGQSWPSTRRAAAEIGTASRPT